MGFFVCSAKLKVASVIIRYSCIDFKLSDFSQDNVTWMDFEVVAGIELDLCGSAQSYIIIIIIIIDVVTVQLSYILFVIHVLFVGAGPARAVK